jgi:hypothetical protein
VAFADQTERHAMEEVDDATGAPVATTKVDATIDNNAVPPNSFVSVEPGPHVIRVTAPGYLPAEKKVTAIPASSDMVDIELQPKPARVSVTTERGARIIVDGRELGIAPLAIDLAPGKHLMTVAHDGRELAGRDLAVTRGQELAVDVPLVTTRRRRLVPWFVGGAGAAALLSATSVGLAFYYQSSAQDHAMDLSHGDTKPQTLADYNSDRDWRDRHVIGVWTFGGAAVALGLTAAWLYYFDKPSSEGVRITPTGVGGSF